MAWELTLVPGNPHPSQQDSTVDVVAARIDPKIANALVRQLNQVCPLENLRHVKRVRRQLGSDGRFELSIILCLSFGCEKWMEEISMDVRKIVETNQLNPFIVKVPWCSATSKQIWEEQCKVWPTSYHPSQNLDSISGVTDEELPSVYNYMKVALELASLCFPGSKVINAAVIVDPSTKQIISTGTDQTFSALENNLFELRAEIQENANIFLSSLPYIWNGSKTEVSCINPWRWMKQGPSDQNPLPCGSGLEWHPLRHAALVAIENAAGRDILRFPYSVSSETSAQSKGNLENCSSKKSAKILKEDAQFRIKNSLQMTHAASNYHLK